MDYKTKAPYISGTPMKYQNKHHIIEVYANLILRKTLLNFQTTRKNINPTHKDATRH
jgi:hypothetical protein